MSRMLEKCLKDLKEGNEGAVDFVEEEVFIETALPLERYKECMEKGGAMEVVFAGADKEGNLYVRNTDGIKIVLREKDLVEDLDYYIPYYKDKFIGNTFFVKIKEIDSINGIVYVKSARSSKNSTKNRIIREIQTELGKGTMPHIAGKPIMIKPDRVYIDILCKGVLGICKVNNWQKGFTRYLETECHEGLIYDFVVTGKLDPIPGKDTAFALSRVPFTNDPWDDIPENIGVGSVVVVKCIDKPKGKSYFWGKSALIDTIDIMCDFNPNLKVLVGNSYKCKVVDFDREGHVFKVVPFEMSGLYVEDKEVVKFMQDRRKRPVRSRR